MKNYINRRIQLMEQLKENSLAIFFSGKEMMRSEDDSYPFSINRNFYYLTGLDQTHSILLISNVNKKVVSTLFTKPNDPLMAKWIGSRKSFEELKETTGVDYVLDEQVFYTHFNAIYNRSRGLKKLNVYLDLWHYVEDQCYSQAHRFAHQIKDKYPALKIRDVYSFITKMRQVKDVYEIKELKKAIAITKSGIEAMMSYIKPGMLEMELEARFNLELAKHGCNLNAFRTIAAGGKNAAILHYVDNNQKLKKGDLFLCDLGATSNYYCADISRVFPVSGKFTKRQKEIYNTVLKGMEVVFQHVKPGVTTGMLNDILIEYYQKELPKIGLKKPVSEYYFHGVSHMLGLDTHDVTIVHNQTKLEKGHVITVEPGLYIEEENIGIRIEDDVLVTDDGCEILSKDIIKTVEEIERFMKGE